MRTRYKNSDDQYLAEYDGGYTQYTMSGSYHSGPYAWTRPGSPTGHEYSKIEDSTDHLQTTKPCHHEYRRHFYYDSPEKAPIVTTSWSVPGNTRRIHNPGMHLLQYQAMSGHGFYNHHDYMLNESLRDFSSSDMFEVSYPKSVADLIPQAKDRFYNTNEVDSLLNAIESPDLTRTLDSINNTIKDLHQPPWIPERERQSRWKALKRLPSLHLGYAFGLAPLISDLKKLNKILPQMGRNFEAYKKRVKRPYVVTARAEGNVKIKITKGTARYFGDIGEYSEIPDNYNNINWWCSDFLGNQAQRLVGVRGVDNARYETEAFQKAQFYLDRIFSAGPATLAWELVPFSFVVDWFVDLSQPINSLDNLLKGSPKKILDMWWSERIALAVEFTKVRSHAEQTNIDNKPYSLYTVKSYHREPIADDTLVTSSGRFGKKQAALSASLVHQIVANLRR